MTKRESALGRWLPIAFYVINIALWLLAGITAQAWDRLWLVVVTLPALVLYIIRTQRGK